MNETELLKLMRKSIDHYARLTIEQCDMEEEDARQELSLQIVLCYRKYVPVSGIAIQTYFSSVLRYTSLRLLDVPYRKPRRQMPYYARFIHAEIDRQIYRTFEIDLIDTIITNDVVKCLSPNSQKVFQLKLEGYTWTAIAKQFQVTSKTLRKNLYNEVSLQHKLFECTVA